MSQQYANYSVNDFDKFDCLKLSKLIYLVILFVMRAYIVWVISISNFQNQTSFIAIAFPEKQVFYMNLASGALGFLLLVVVSLRRPESYTWVKNIWPHARKLMIIALFFDLFVNIFAYYYWQLTSIAWLSAQVAITLALIYYSAKSKRLAINLQEFPEKLPEK